jgi:putative FmdB family regulatory protein
MPIYAYKCESCDHAKDVLQKMSDPVLTECPSCGKATFQKQVTAAGFQLKGGGWYVTDFREGNKAKDSSKETSKASEGKDSATATPATSSDSAATTSTATASPAATPVSSSTPSSTP